ncbi:MAG: hypothetical protein HYV18_04470 [Gammaproteobacteria bacterium]|nr:hypothetical protein [Gammaproteobacteria bacterium]
MHPRSFRLLAVTALVPLMSACAGLEPTEEEQLAYRGGAAPSGNPCLFGGVTPRAVQHCATVNFGVEGFLGALNRQVLDALPARADCEEHAAEVVRQLASYRDYRAERVYSCPRYVQAGDSCHVSVLVAAPDGARYVLDNGAVLANELGSHTGRFESFAQAVGRYWIGIAPSQTEISTALDL